MSWATGAGGMRAIVASGAIVVWLLGCVATPSTPPSSDSAGSAQPGPSACGSGCTRDQPNCAGWVRLAFDISNTGTVGNARVMRSCPADEFSQAALNAVSSWTYPSDKFNHKNLRVQLDLSPE